MAANLSTIFKKHFRRESFLQNLKSNRKKGEKTKKTSAILPCAWELSLYATSSSCSLTRDSEETVA